jgi:peptide/nickel transport system substrate-binding protein
VVESGGPSVSWISPRTNEVVATVPVGNGPVGIAVGEGAVWVTTRFDGTVEKIDPDRGKVVATIPVGQDPSGVAVGFGGVWVAVGGANEVVRIDPRTDDVTRSIGVGSGPTTVVVSPEGVWAANGLDGTVSLIDPHAGRVASVIEVGDGPSGIASTEGAVWVANESDGTLSQIDPGSRSVSSTVRIGSSPRGLETAGESLWVTVGGTATSHRGGTLRIVSQSEIAPITLDPGAPYDEFSLPIFGITGDGLMGFKRVGGADGGTLVPDLAVSMPTVTDGGRTYAFELRPEVAYSNGEVVVPSDFRRGIERSFGIEGTLQPEEGLGLTTIDGATECIQSPDTCDLSEGIETDDSAGTVTFHLVEPDPEFLYKLALPFSFPVPPSTPDEEQTNEGIPGTGPYRLEGPITDDGLVLVRNEHFREWSVAAQPDGNVDRIEWSFRGTSEEHVDAVANGEADYLVAPESKWIDDLSVGFAGQLYLRPIAGTFYLTLNTALPPFDDVDVRRALNLSVDRRRVVEIWGGPASAKPTCQILPPNFPGYEPYCPYTIDPGAEGQWTGPDLETAERLVRRSGTAGTRVTFWYPRGFDGTFRVMAEYFVHLLKELGFVSEMRSTSDIDAHHAAVFDSGRGVQIAPVGWFADFPAASNFIATQLTCDSFQPNAPAANLNAAAFCDREIDAMIERAVRIQTEDPAASGEAWADVDREITDQAPYVFLLTAMDVGFVSERIGNFQYHPVWRLLLAQVWVR